LDDPDPDEPVTVDFNYEERNQTTENGGDLDLQDEETSRTFALVDNVIECVGSTTSRGFDRNPYGRIPVEDFGALFRDRLSCLFEVIRELVDGVRSGTCPFTTLREDLTLDNDEERADAAARMLLKYALWSYELIFLRGEHCTHTHMYSRG
jgi:hypothetical protein